MPGQRERTCCENNRRESCKGCGQRLKELENEVAKLNGLLQNFHAIVTSYYLSEDATKSISDVDIKDTSESIKNSTKSVG